MTKITPELLLQAYKIGVFPMANNQADPTIEFFDPDPRGIIPLEAFHVPRSLRKLIRKGEFYVTYNTAFSTVLSACANITVNRPTTWINEEIKVLYQKLFDMGYCHSIEVWCDDNIVGGLYGVSIGAAFFGESMFSLKPNSSKIALVHLVASLKHKGFLLLDSQFTNEHLVQFGAIGIRRGDYKKLLASAINKTAEFPAEPVALDQVLDPVHRRTQTS